ncbi:hypothetical protein SAMN05660766_2425 [Curtobacterium sp. 314Chir4.1]|nr:hypothetical protein SAMN05660766_2425 [Curtobacterium sp. 314Chir4.1]
MRSARRLVAFDATSVRASPTPGAPRQSNYNSGWYVKEPSPAFRHAQREIEFTIMTRNDSEPAPRLLDSDYAR